MRLRSLATFTCVGIAAGCSLVRSFDGFGDGVDAGDYADSAPEGDAATADSSPSDATATGDATGLDGATDSALGDATGDTTHPPVTCTLTRLATFGSTPASADYPNALSLSDAAVYVVTGSRVDGGSDGSTVYRLPKTGGTPKVILESAEVVEGCAEHSGELICGLGKRIARVLADGGTTTLAPVAQEITDFDEGPDGLVLGSNTNAAWYYPWDSGVLQQRSVAGRAYRIRADDSRIYYATETVGRLQSLAISDWARADAGPCNLVSNKSATHLSVCPEGLFWVDLNRNVQRTPLDACDAGGNVEIFSSPTYGLTANPKFVFIREATRVRLQWVDTASPACARALLDGGSTADLGGVMAAFAGNDVYFLAPPALYHLATTVP